MASTRSIDHQQTNRHCDEILLADFIFLLFYHCVKTVWAEISNPSIAITSIAIHGPKSYDSLWMFITLFVGIEGNI